MKEIWKDIKGYKGLYQISNFGRVKSLERKVRKQNSERTVKEKILKQSIGRKYMQVILSKKCKTNTKTVHRLVAEAFIPNPNNYPEVNHIDANTNNNCVNNLEWCSRYENMQHAKRMGLIKGPKAEKCYWYKKYGAEHVRSKKIIQLSRNNEFIKEWDSLADVKRDLGIFQSNICKCLKGKRQTAGGYKWKYVEVIEEIDKI